MSEPRHTAYWISYGASHEADAAFRGALEREYGSAAGDMRYRTDLHSPHVYALGERHHAAALRMSEALAELRQADVSDD